MPVTVLGSGYSLVIKTGKVIPPSDICAVIVEFLQWEHPCGWGRATEGETSERRDQRGGQGAGDHERVVLVKGMDFIPTVINGKPWKASCKGIQLQFCKYYSVDSNWQA